MIWIIIVHYCAMYVLALQKSSSGLFDFTLLWFLLYLSLPQNLRYVLIINEYIYSYGTWNVSINTIRRRDTGKYGTVNACIFNYSAQNVYGNIETQNLMQFLKRRYHTCNFLFGMLSIVIRAVRHETHLTTWQCTPINATNLFFSITFPEKLFFHPADTWNVTVASI